MHDTEPTVGPPTKAAAASDDDGDEPSKHTPEATREVAESIRELLEGDEEGDLDPYKKVAVSGKNVTFKLTHNDTDLAYLVTVAPVDD